MNLWYFSSVNLRSVFLPSAASAMFPIGIWWADPPQYYVRVPHTSSTYNSFITLQIQEMCISPVNMCWKYFQLVTHPDSMRSSLITFICTLRYVHCGFPSLYKIPMFLPVASDSNCLAYQENHRYKK